MVIRLQLTAQSYDTFLEFFKDSGETIGRHHGKIPDWIKVVINSRWDAFNRIYVEIDGQTGRILGWSPVTQENVDVLVRRGVDET